MHDGKGGEIPGNGAGLLRPRTLGDIECDRNRRCRKRPPPLVVTPLGELAPVGSLGAHGIGCDGVSRIVAELFGSQKREKVIVMDELGKHARVIPSVIGQSSLFHPLFLAVICRR